MGACEKKKTGKSEMQPMNVDHLTWTALCNKLSIVHENGKGILSRQQMCQDVPEANMQMGCVLAQPTDQHGASVTNPDKFGMKILCQW